MSQEAERSEITKRKVVCRIPDTPAVMVRRDVGFQPGSRAALTMDIYTPYDSRAGTLLPAVVFVLGYPDPGFRAMLGCKQKEMESYISWARLTAASGLGAVTYTNEDPEADLDALLRYIEQNGASLGIDAKRIGIWSCSGNAPTALSLLIKRAPGIKCAVICYGLLFDLDESTAVADAAVKWRFANPCGGKSVDDLPQDTPLLVVRAGRDEFPAVNESIDRFVVKAVKRNLPITFINHAPAPHGFDVIDDSDASREIIREIAAFSRFHLLK